MTISRLKKFMQGKPVGLYFKNGGKYIYQYSDKEISIAITEWIIYHC